MMLVNTCATYAKAARCAGLLAAFCLFVALLLVNPVHAWADFAVYVGYSGGPYYEKARYSDAEMQAMSDAKLYEYTAFDSMPSLRKGFAYGVRLSTLFSNAGVSSAELKRFYFSTKDGYIADDGVEGYGAWTYDYLVNTARYYFPNLRYAYNFEEQEIDDIDLAWEGAVSVPAVLAYSSSFTRVSSEDDASWTNTEGMSSSGYRLLFGQTNPTVADARAYADVIKAMTCIFQGTPELTFDTDESGNLFDAKVGETVTIKAPTISAADEMIEAYGKYDFNWSVSDTGVADFVRDEDGNVLIAEDGSVQLVIKGEGDVSITASYGNSPSSDYIASASAGGKGNGSGTGDGDGDGTDGDADDGSGTGDGDGKGNGQGDGADNYNGQGNENNNGTNNNEIVIDASGQNTTTAVVAQDSSSGGSNSSSNSQGGSGQQAWKISAQGSQLSLMDDSLFGSPLAIAISVFALFVVGYIGRVVLTEKQKDPYVDARLKG